MDKTELTYQIGEILFLESLRPSRWRADGQNRFERRYYFITDYLEDSKEYIIDVFAPTSICVSYKAQELDHLFQRVKQCNQNTHK